MVQGLPFWERSYHWYNWRFQERYGKSSRNALKIEIVYG